MKILDKFFEPNQAVTLILSGLIGMLIQASFDNTYDYKVQDRWYLILLGFPVWRAIRKTYWTFRWEAYLKNWEQKHGFLTTVLIEEVRKWKW